VESWVKQGAKPTVKVQSLIKLVEGGGPVATVKEPKKKPAVETESPKAEAPAEAPEAKAEEEAKEPAAEAADETPPAADEEKPAE
jgi:hypothetical protein